MSNNKDIFTNGDRHNSAKEVFIVKNVRNKNVDTVKYVKYLTGYMSNTKCGTTAYNCWVDKSDSHKKDISDLA